jgi:predicted ATPase
VWFVDLGRVSDPAGVDGAVAEAVGAPVERNRDPWEVVLDHLRDRETVVVLDNCEHLGGAVGSRVDSLLRACPAVRVLATSREPLGMRAEQVWRPDALAAESSAADLFCQRAGIVHPDQPTRAAVVELCRRLDGLPLAIELAAARADVATPAEIVARLDADRGLGTSRDPGLDPRQRSLEDLIGWSYDLLTAAEQIAFRRLGVFVAGFDLEAASAAVASVAGSDSYPADAAVDGDGDVDAFDVADLVWSLLAKSLIAADPTAGTTRYRMLVTVRAHAHRLLAAHGELAPVASRVARHYLRAFGPDIDKADPDFHAQRAREVDNLHQLIGLLATSDQPTAQALACVVLFHLRISSPGQSLKVGRSLLERLDEPSPARVALLAYAAALASACGDSRSADELLESAMALRGSVGEPPWIEGFIDQQRGIIAVQRSEPRLAVEIATAGLARAASPAARCRLYNLLGIAQMDLDDFDSARWAEEQALELSRGRENHVSLAADLCNVAESALRAGDLSAAAAHQHEALEVASRIGHSTIVAFSAIVAARILGHQRGWARATRLQAAADNTLASLGVALYPSDRQLSDELLAAAAEHLGADEFERQRALGASRPIEETIAETQEVLAEAATSPR